MSNEQEISHLRELIQKEREFFLEKFRALEDSMGKQFTSVNEFRGQQADIIALFPTKAEVESRFSSLQDKVTLLVAAQQTAQGRSAGVGWLWGVIIGVIGVLIAVTALILREL